MNDFIDLLVYTRRLFPCSSFYILGHSLGGSIVAVALNRKPSTNMSTENNLDSNNINCDDGNNKNKNTTSTPFFQFVAGVILLDVV